VLEMEACWPSGVVLRGMASNHRMLRRLKTVVVSDPEKARLTRQVGTGKTFQKVLRSQRSAATATDLGGIAAWTGDSGSWLRGRAVLGAHRRWAGHGPSPAATVACRIRRRSQTPQV
jgi:hypothetical protein